jgi:hypothetical protein
MAVQEKTFMREMVKTATFGERDVAEVKAGGKDLRLFCEFTDVGFTATVYDVGLDQKVMDEIADSFEHGKQKCEDCVRSYLSGTVPKINWIHHPAPSS